MYYRKYRPQKFSEISQPNDVATALANQIKNKKISHAYLFVGPRGTGKTTVARLLAKALNCVKIDKNGDPCDECESCTAIKTANYLDLIEIDAASNRGIDDIRELKDKINLAPTSGKKKIYIIDEVHMLTTEAFNALLKTLEEPPSHANFVLCTTEAHKVPETIKSRCQVFQFKRATVSQLVTKLEQIVEKERVKSKIKKTDLEKIAKASMGGFRDAETLLQQIVEGELDVDSFVGSSSKQEFIDFVDSLILKDSKSAIRQINNLFETGIDLHTWSVELMHYLRDLLFISAEADEGMMDVTETDYSSMEEQAAKLEPKEIAYVLEVFSKASNNIKGSTIPQLPLEIAVVKVCDGQMISVGSGINTGPSGELGGFTRIGTKIKAEPKKTPKTSKSKSGNGATISTPLSAIEDSWSDVLKGTVAHNHGVQALLKASKPVEIKGNSLVLEVFYKFHKERLESPKNRKIVETVLNEIFDEVFALECILSEQKPKKKSKNESGELTDKNVMIPSDPGIGDALVDVFDGALPL